MLNITDIETKEKEKPFCYMTVYLQVTLKGESKPATARIHMDVHAPENIPGMAPRSKVSGGRFFISRKIWQNWKTHRRVSDGSMSECNMVVKNILAFSHFTRLVLCMRKNQKENNGCSRHGGTF